MPSASGFLVDDMYPHAEYVRIVHDNLNTHTPAALYEVFPPKEARRILRRVEFHFTRHPRQLAEYGRNRDQHFPCSACLSRRVDSMGQLRTRINEVELERNAGRCTISWRFTCNDARNTLQDLYPDLTS